MSKIDKLGLGILVFDDVCHLRNICTELRDLCDDITLCLQNTSYHGDPIQPKIVDFCRRLVSEGVVDDMVFFESIKEYPDKGENAPRFVETDKRINMLIFHKDQESVKKSGTRTRFRQCKNYNRLVSICSCRADKC